MYYGRQPMRQRGGRGCTTLVIALVMAGVALWRYGSSVQTNPVTGERQHVTIDQKQEIALGAASAPQMAAQFGGKSRDYELASLVSQMGAEIVERSDAGKGPYPYQFHVLADRQTVNAFALPGGQVFITEGLARRLKTPGQLAGVLGHEIAHVVARHSAEHLAKAELTQGLTGAVAIATYDPGDPSSRNKAILAAAVGKLVNMKFGREDELESDRLGVRYMAQAGFDPRAMLSVMEVLQSASGSGRTPEFMSTHPNPQNRMGRIREAIREEFPNGVPAGLQR